MRDHILKICSGSVLIGHGVKTDLKVLMLGEVDYIDTGFFLDQELSELEQFQTRNPRKLKDLTSEYLNAKIQDSCHSSIIDARASMALFKLRQNYLQTRQLRYDPVLEQSAKRKTHRAGKAVKNRSHNKENVLVVNSDF